MATKTVECPECGGTGLIDRTPANYPGPANYRECDECDGRGTVTREAEEAEDETP